MPDNSRESWIRRHERDLSLLALTWAAGNIDAIGYLGLGRVFTANMTGNIVLLAFATAHVSGLSIARSLTALSAFLAGARDGYTECRCPETRKRAQEEQDPGLPVRRVGSDRPLRLTQREVIAFLAVLDHALQ